MKLPPNGLSMQKRGKILWYFLKEYVKLLLNIAEDLGAKYVFWALLASAFAAVDNERFRNVSKEKIHGTLVLSGIARVAHIEKRQAEKCEAAFRYGYYYHFMKLQKLKSFEEGRQLISRIEDRMRCTRNKSALVLAVYDALRTLLLEKEPRKVFVEILSSKKIASRVSYKSLGLVNP